MHISHPFTSTRKCPFTQNAKLPHWNIEMLFASGGSGCKDNLESQWNRRGSLQGVHAAVVFWDKHHRRFLGRQPHPALGAAKAKLFWLDLLSNLFGFASSLLLSPCCHRSTVPIAPWRLALRNWAAPSTWGRRTGSQPKCTKQRSTIQLHKHRHVRTTFQQTGETIGAARNWTSSSTIYGTTELI